MHPTLTSNIKFMNFYPFNDIETISPRPASFLGCTHGFCSRNVLVWL